MSVTPIEPSARATYNLGINASQLGIGRHADKFSIKNVYIDVDDTHIKVVPFDFTDDVDDNGSVLALPATTIGSAYQIQFYAAGKMLLSAFFEMPERDCFLVELKLYTAMPAREQYPEGAPGKSAYQSAIDTGVFEGTEEQWAQWQKPTINDVDLLADIKVINDVATLPSGVTVPRRIGSDVYTLSTFNDRLADVDKVLTQTGGTVDIGGVPVKTIKQATDDALNVATAPIYDFVDAGKDEVVERPLGPSFRSLNHYLEYLEAIKSMFTQATGNVVVDGVTRKSLHQALLEVDSAITSVSDAINNTAVEGGVLADTFVTITANGVGAVARNLRDVKSMQKTLKDFGGLGGSNNDTAALNKAVAASDDILIDTKNSVINQAIIDKTVNVKGTNNATFTKSTSNNHLLYVGHPSWSPLHLTHTVDNVTVRDMTFRDMPLSTSDDFAAITYRNNRAPASIFNRFFNVETALTASSKTIDFMSIGDYAENTGRMALQLFGARYPKVIGLTTHNNGDNSNPGYSGVNNNGWKVGIRLVSDTTGAIIANSSLRDRTNAITHQAGSHSNILTGNYIENCAETAVSVTTLSHGRSYYNVHNGVIIKDSALGAFGMSSSSRSRINALIADDNSIPAVGVTTAATLGDTVTVNGIAPPYMRVKYSGGSGNVPAVGTDITQGGVTVKLVQVEDNEFQKISVGSPLPESGEFLVTVPTTGYLSKTMFDNINVSVKDVYPASGSHRFDATVSKSHKVGLGVGSSGNLITLIGSQINNGEAITISGNYNLVDVVLTHCEYTTRVLISGDNNIVRIVDASSQVGGTPASVRITGKNNTVTATCRGKVLLTSTATSNNINVNCDILVADGDKNIFSGRCNSLFVQSSATAYLFNGFYGANFSESFTGITATDGSLVIPHNLIASPKKSSVAFNGDAPKFVSVISKSASNIKVKIYNLDGTPLVTTSVTLDVILSL